MDRWFLPLIFVTVACVLVKMKAVPMSLFYPFGPLRGDEIMEPGDDISTNEITLDETIVFFNTSFRTIYVSKYNS